MSAEVESAQRIIEQYSPVENVLERFSLPTGFVTEKGSTYQYTDKGRITRHKYDGSDHEQGIAVFLPNSPQGDSMAVRVLNNLDKSKASGARLTIRIVERAIDKETGQSVGKYRTSTSDIVDPSNLGVVLIDGNEVVDGVAVSITPEIGTTVLEMDTLADGSINIHPGHKVVDVIQ